VFGENEASGGVVKAVPILADDASSAEFVRMSHRTVPVVKLNEDEVVAYEKDPVFKPKLDYKPTGKNAQPSQLKILTAQVCAPVKRRNRF
jgi:hypothetical protein